MSLLLGNRVVRNTVKASQDDVPTSTIDFSNIIAYNKTSFNEDNLKNITVGYEKQCTKNTLLLIERLKSIYTDISMGRTNENVIMEANNIIHVLFENKLISNNCSIQDANINRLMNEIDDVDVPDNSVVQCTEICYEAATTMKKRLNELMDLVDAGDRTDYTKNEIAAIVDMLNACKTS